MTDVNLDRLIAEVFRQGRIEALFRHVTTEKQILQLAGILVQRYAEIDSKADGDYKLTASVHKRAWKIDEGIGSCSWDVPRHAIPDKLWPPQPTPMHWATLADSSNDGHPRGNEDTRGD